jgi:hypothetical protein
MAETQHPITEFDFFFLSYDEPNADKHWADLLDKAPWAKRVHGVKGFAAAHEECARQSETDWFVTVDADNIVLPDFLDQTVTLDIEDRPNLSYTWNGLNMMNGLRYGNGGVKLWSKAFVLGGGIGHEHSDDPRHAVDFCWQPDYITIPQTFSEVWNNGSPYQAWRVGFREGVKLTLNHGERIPAKEMRHKLHPVNLRNIRIWSSVGMDVEYGLWAILGARMGWQSMCDLAWDHTVVRDFDWFRDQWQGLSKMNINELISTVQDSGKVISQQTGINMPLLDEQASEFFRDSFRLRND